MVDLYHKAKQQHHSKEFYLDDHAFIIAGSCPIINFLLFPVQSRRAPQCKNCISEFSLQILNNKTWKVTNTRVWKSLKFCQYWLDLNDYLDLIHWVVLLLSRPHSVQQQISVSVWRTSCSGIMSDFPDYGDQTQYQAESICSQSLCGNTALRKKAAVC